MSDLRVSKMAALVEVPQVPQVRVILAVLPQVPQVRVILAALPQVPQAGSRVLVALAEVLLLMAVQAEVLLEGGVQVVLGSIPGWGGWDHLIGQPALIQ
jgi:hypothetical protein